jgi:beta-glucosidase
MTFPSDFLWGTSTSAHQVEGNNERNDWWAWEQEEGNILQNHKSGLACDWWEHAEADLDRAAEMGTNAHRMSVEWSRIEPEPSVFDNAALERYREILGAMHKRGIEPMVSLHHFSNPIWLVEKGGFHSEIVVDYFQRYVAKVVDALGDLIPKWVTINEPMVYVSERYLRRKHPSPQRTGWRAARQAIHQLMACHAAAYHTIKDQHPESLVGLAKNMAVFEGPAAATRLDKWWAGRIGWIFNEMWMQSMVDGQLRWPVGRGRIKGLAGSFDFVGVDYYTRFLVNFPPNQDIIQTSWDEGAVVSDGGYGEVYPPGLYQVIKDVLRYQKPIYITENGLPDAADRLRASFLLTHLREIWRAISFAFPVMGYYHWSLVDNFEWQQGWTQRFGLIEMNPETQERRLRDSGRLYSEICRTSSISSDMAEKYAPELMPIMFPGESPQPRSDEIQAFE